MTFQLNSRQLYNLGRICFFLAGVMGIWALIGTWNITYIANKLSSILGTIFNFGLSAFFNYLLKMEISNKEQDVSGETQLMLDEWEDSQ